MLVLWRCDHKIATKLSNTSLSLHRDLDLHRAPTLDWITAQTGVILIMPFSIIAVGKDTSVFLLEMRTLEGK